MGKKLYLGAAGALALLAIVAYFALPRLFTAASALSGGEQFAVGKPFPSFALVDVNGKAINRKTLAGKPYILWFTAGFCVPCQIGAVKVSKLDDTLGGKAFRVVVVFVDPREPLASLQDWKRKFARPDWQLAYDSKADSLVKKFAIKFLDTKYLVDSKGILQNADYQMVDDRYIGLLRAAAKRG